MKRLITAIMVALILPGVALIQPARPAAAAKLIAHLEWLPIVSGSACAISSSCPAASNGIRVSRGLRIDSTSHTEIRLDGRYQDLYGTIYRDDASGNPVALALDFFNNDDPANRVSLLHAAFTLGHNAVPFAISVHGVHDLYITPVSDYSHTVFDLVASVSRDGAPPPVAHAGTVTPLFPASGTPVPAGSKVLFTWKPFPGATVYALQIWLIHRPSAKPLAAGVPVTAAATASGRTSYTWSDRGFPAGAYQYTLLPLDAAGNAIGSWSQPVQFSIAG